MGKFSLVILLSLIVAISATPVNADEIETDDPYTYYKTIYDSFYRAEPREVNLQAFLTLAKAYVIFAQTEGEIRDDFDHFWVRTGLKFPSQILSPTLLAYIFAVKYRDDPRYTYEFLFDEAEPELVLWADYACEYGHGSFPLLVLAYRDDGLPALVEFWLKSTTRPLGRERFQYTVWLAAGRNCLPYIMEMFENEELSEDQELMLINSLDLLTVFTYPGGRPYTGIAGVRYLFNGMPGSPYQLNDDDILARREFYLDYYFSHVGEHNGIRTFGYVFRGWENPDLAWLLDFIYESDDFNPLNTVMYRLEGRIVADDPRVLRLLPKFSAWLDNEKTFWNAYSLIKALTFNEGTRLEEPFASVTYPKIMKLMMEGEHRHVANTVLSYFADFFEEKLISAWSDAEISRVIDLHYKYSDHYFSSASEVLGIAFANPGLDLMLYADYALDMIREYDPVKIKYGIHNPFQASLEILNAISANNPGVLYDGLPELHEEVVRWADYIFLWPYELILDDIENAGYDPPPEYRKFVDSKTYEQVMMY